jgi:hypothetical protein
MWILRPCGVIPIDNKDTFSEHYGLSDYSPALIVMGTAMIVGFVGQFIKIKIDPEQSNKNVFWSSLAAGFSSAITLGFVSEYTKLSPTFLIALSGVVGWGGVSIITSLVTIVQTWVESSLKAKYGGKNG